MKKLKLNKLSLNEISKNSQMKLNWDYTNCGMSEVEALYMYDGK